MMSQLRDVKHDRINGVDPDNLGTFIQDVPDYAKSHRSRELSCLVSHLHAIHYIYTNKIPKALILEDDMQVSDLLLNNDVSIGAPVDWEILQLFTSSKNFYASTYRSKRLWSSWHDGNTSAGAYVVTYKAASKITQRYFSEQRLDCHSFSAHPIFLVADYLLFDACSSYTYKYPLAHEKRFKSNFGFDHEEYSDDFRRFLLQSGLLDKHAR